MFSNRTEAYSCLSADRFKHLIKMRSTCEASLPFHAPRATCLSTFQMRPELDNVLQCLSLNGYSILSLISDVLSHASKWEDRRIKCLLEGVERDAVDICARLLSHNTTSTSVFTWALGVALQSQTRKEHSPNFMTGHPLSLPNGDIVFPGLSDLSFGRASTPNPLEKLLNIGRTQCTCSSSGVVPPTSSYSELRAQL